MKGAGRMGMPNDLVLVRHGVSQGNEASKAAWQGDLSHYTEEFLRTPGHRWHLGEAGPAQAAAAGEWIRNNVSQYFDRYYVSPYVPTRETAANLGLQDAAWRLNRSIRERDSGDLDNRPRVTAKERPELELNVIAKEINPLYAADPNGESIAMVAEDRVRNLLGTFNRKCDGQKVICVTHGNFMWATRLVLESLTDEEWLDRWHDEEDTIVNCEVFHYTRLDPATGVQAKRLSWRRRVKPVLEDGVWVMREQDWVELTIPTFTNEGLLASIPDTVEREQ